MNLFLIDIIYQYCLDLEYLLTVCADCLGMSKACAGNQFPWKTVSKHHDRLRAGCALHLHEPEIIYLVVKFEGNQLASNIFNGGLFP